MANFNFNKVILGGRITKDVELKTTNSGLSIAQFSVAVSRRTKDGKNESDFINCSAFGQQAEFISKFFRKGSSICIVGRLQNNNYTDKDNVKHYTTNVMVDEAYFVDSKSEEQVQAPAQTAQVQTAQTANIPQSGYVPDTYTQATMNLSNIQPAPTFASINDDDDLPF